MQNQNSTKHVIALICAAGVGKRFGSEIPKQYSSVNLNNSKKAVLELTIEKFLQNNSVDHVIVGINKSDTYFEKIVNELISSEVYSSTVYDKFESYNNFNNYYQSNVSAILNKLETWYKSNFSIEKNDYVYLYLLKFIKNLKFDCLKKTKLTKLSYCYGFGERYHSVYSLLSSAIQLAFEKGYDLQNTYVLIHDAARCNISDEEIDNLIINLNDLNFNWKGVDFDEFKEFGAYGSIKTDLFVKKFKREYLNDLSIPSIFKKILYQNFCSAVQEPSGHLLTEEKKDDDIEHKIGLNLGTITNEVTDVYISDLADKASSILKYYLEYKEILKTSDSNNIEQVFSVLVPYVNISDTVVLRTKKDNEVEFLSIDRNDVYRHQTPQGTNLLYYYYLYTTFLLFTCDLDFWKNIHSCKYFIPPFIIFELILSISCLSTSAFEFTYIGKKLVTLYEQNSEISIEMFKEKMSNSLKSLTDDASFFTFILDKVKYIQGCSTNIKITLPEDLIFVQAMLNSK